MWGSMCVNAGWVQNSINTHLEYFLDLHFYQRSFLSLLGYLSTPCGGGEEPPSCSILHSTNGQFYWFKWQKMSPWIDINVFGGFKNWQSSALTQQYLLGAKEGKAAAAELLQSPHLKRRQQKGICGKGFLTFGLFILFDIERPLHCAI